MITRKLCYLVTSQEKSQPNAGNGSSNTDSPTPIGKPIAAILRKPTDSSLPLEIPLSSPSDGRSLWDRKWKFYGDGHKYTEVFSEQLSKEVVLVEDLISAHKVAQVTSCVCLFGVEINDLVIKQLKALKRPVTLWLDDDQYSLLPKKINRLQSLLDWPVRYVHTPKDPKAYTTQEIREILM